jgi:hypothetical protein
MSLICTKKKKKMKSLLTYIMMNLLVIAVNAQAYVLVPDEKSGLMVPVGTCSREELMTTDFAGSYAEEYGNYVPASRVLDSMRGVNDEFSVKVILGVWCSDSREQVPRFLKIMDQAFPQKMVIFYCVDRSKTAGNTDVSAFKVERVPLFIFFRNGEEAGRITETPQTTLEEDMLKILLKD